MRKIISSSLSLLVVGAMLLANCKGSQSEVEPQNTTPNARSQNATESANVIYSNWITVPAWAALTNSANYIYYRYTVSGITQLDQNMLNQGTILMYARFDANSGVNQMPFKRAWNRTPTSLIYDNWSYEARPNQITVTIDPETNGYVAPVGAQVRYILTPGVMPAGRKGNIDYSNYEEVKEAFNLPD
jgi:hypothetical protein